MNFDRIAPFYDLLATIVFWGSIKNCQIESLRSNPPRGTVLIMGGGTGWIIPYIFESDEVERLYYIEASRKMIERAQKNCPVAFKGKITFIHGDEFSIPSHKLDAVITNFFLDCLDENRLESVVNTLHKRLIKGGNWYLSDFRIDKRWYYRMWQEPLIGLMYAFFRLTTKLDNMQLADYRLLLDKRCQFALIENQYSIKSIFSVVYRN